MLTSHWLLVVTPISLFHHPAPTIHTWVEAAVVAIIPSAVVEAACQAIGTIAVVVAVTLADWALVCGGAAAIIAVPEVLGCIARC